MFLKVGQVAVALWPRRTQVTISLICGVNISTPEMILGNSVFQSGAGGQQRGRRQILLLLSWNIETCTAWHCSCWIANWQHKTKKYYFTCIWIRILDIFSFYIFNLQIMWYPAWVQLELQRKTLTVNVSTLFNFHPACIFDDRTTLAVQSFDCYESR